MIIKINKEHGVYVARAIDDNGKEIDHITGLSKPSAKRMLEEKLGIRKKRKHSIKNKTHKPKGRSHSIMTGLLHVTEVRNWKNTK